MAGIENIDANCKGNISLQNYLKVISLYFTKKMNV
jgi:hypothetical protein